MGGVTLNDLNLMLRSHYGVELRQKSEVSGPNATAGAKGAQGESGVESPASAKVAVPEEPRAKIGEIDRLMLSVARESCNEVTRADVNKAKFLLPTERKELGKLTDELSDLMAKIKKLSVNTLLKDPQIQVGDKTVSILPLAIEKQSELAETLRDLANSPRFQDEKEVKDGVQRYVKDFRPVRRMLFTLSERCDARASELGTLFAEMSTLAETMKNSQNANEKLKHPFGKEDVGSMMSGMAGLMHGNDAIHKFGEKIKKIETHLAGLANDKSVSKEKFDALQEATKELSDELKKSTIAKEMSRDIVSTLTMRLEHLDKEISLHILAAQQKAKRNTAIQGASGNEDVEETSKEVMSEIIKRTQAWGADYTKLSGQDLISAFSRGGNVSDILEARANGLDNDEELPFTDKNLLKSERLGSGQFNTVYKLTYRMDDGSEKDFVFKPELPGRTGLHGFDGWHEGFEDSQQALKLNLATCDLAETLGLENLTGKNYVTIHNGQYGLLMELAPGQTGAKLEEADIEKLKKPDVLGTIAKQLNDLQWFDVITGQGDRNIGNLLIDVGKTGTPPKVTAIDNDVSFTPYLVGAYKFDVRYNKDRFDFFQENLEDICKIVHGKKWEARYNEIMKLVKKNNYIVDTSDPKNTPKELYYAIRKSFGYQRLTIPQQMSRSLYQKLMSLSETDIENLAVKLSKNIDKKKSIDATVKRLKEVIEIAKSYNQEGKIVEDEDWKKDKKVILREIESPVTENERRDMNKTMLEYVDHETANILNRCLKGRINPEELTFQYSK